MSHKGGNNFAARATGARNLRQNFCQPFSVLMMTSNQPCFSLILSVAELCHSFSLFGLLISDISKRHEIRSRKSEHREPNDL